MGALESHRSTWRGSLAVRDQARALLDAMLVRQRAAEEAEEAANEAFAEKHRAFEGRAGELAIGDGDPKRLKVAKQERREAEEGVLEAEAGAKAVQAKVVELRRAYAVAAAAAHEAGIAYRSEER